MMAGVRFNSVVGILMGLCLATDAHAQTAKWAFASSTPIDLPEVGQASPYPSTLAVSGVTGMTYHLSVRLTISHPSPQDLDIVLLAPSGLAVMLLSDAGSGSVGGWSHTVLTFDDCAPRTLQYGVVPAGRYRPTNNAAGDLLDSPAPAGTYSHALAEFNWRSPNGTWQLFAVDDLDFNAGSIESWSMTIFTQPTPWVGAPGSGINPVSCMAPDYDGDGRTDVAVYRPQSGEWFISQSGSDGVVARRSWGAVASSGLGDVAVPADYDGDGLADVAVFRRATGDWFVSSSFDGSFRQISFGAAASSHLGDTPVPGDYDGDGQADQAIYRATTGEWFVRGSAGGVITTIWGLPAGGDYAAR